MDALCCPPPAKLARPTPSPLTDNSQQGGNLSKRAKHFNTTTSAHNGTPSHSTATTPQPPPSPPQNLRLPPEIIATIGAFCCRSTLNIFMLTSRTIRNVCHDPRHVTMPWPTSRGCPLVKTACCPSLDDDIPIEPEERYDDFGEETVGFRMYRKELRGVTPPLSKLVMLYDAVGSSSWMVLQHQGVSVLDYEGEDCYITPRTMQAWNKEYGLMYEEHYPYFDTKPAITPPMGKRDTRFLIVAVRRGDPPGVRMVEINPPSHKSKQHDAEPITTRRIRLPCDETIENIQCVVKGSDGPCCLVFMDRGESAVKCCRITIEEGKTQRLTLSQPVVLVSDPSRTGDHNTRRSSLASFSNSERSIIAFSYDFLDTHITIYDMKRQVSVVVPIPEGAGWIRDVEFSPDGRTLVAAHCTFRETLDMASSCAISIYDCDVDRIERVSQRPTKLFRMKEHGYCTDVTFSPKGTKLAFEWRPTGSSRTGIFGRERVGIVDFSPLKESNDRVGQISFDFLNELAAWERFVLS